MGIWMSVGEGVVVGELENKIDWLWYGDSANFVSDRTTSQPPTMQLWGGDFWGAIPRGSKPTQHIWSQLYRYGENSYYSNEVVHSQDGKSKRRNNGNIADMLNSFGDETIDPPNSGCLTSNSGSCLAMAETMYVHKQPSGGWIKQVTNAPGTVCTPFNFPNCTLQPMRDDQAVTTLVSDLDNRGKLPAGAPKHYMMDEWMTVIDDLYAHYAANGTDYLLDVNPRETTSWDPCKDAAAKAPTYMKLVVATAFTVAIRVVQFVFIPESNVLLGVSGNMAMAAAPFAAGWFLADSVIDGTNKQQDNSRAAAALLYGAGMVAGSMVGQVLADQNQAAGAVLGAAAAYGLNYYFNNPVTSILGYSAGPSRLVLWIIEKIMGAALAAKCKFDYSDALMALAPGDAAGDLLHEQIHVRRWDVASIAAMMTDEALGSAPFSMPGQRNSWQAEYIYRGLLMGPSIMLAGIPDPAGASVLGGSSFNGALVNPVGEISPIGYTSKPGMNAQSGLSFQPGVLSDWTGQAGQFKDGLFNWGKKDAVLHNNTFAAQNFGAMRFSAFENPDHYDLSFAMHVKTNLDAYLAALTKSCTHENYLKMKSIPGSKAPPLKGTLEPLKPPTVPGTFEPITKAPNPGHLEPLLHPLTPTHKAPPPGKLEPILFPMKPTVPLPHPVGLHGQYSNDPVAHMLAGLFSSSGVLKAPNASYYSVLGYVKNAIVPSINAPGFMNKYCDDYGIPDSMCEVTQTSKDWIAGLQTDASSFDSAYGAIMGLGLNKLDDVTLSHYVQAWHQPLRPSIASYDAWQRGFFNNVPAAQKPYINHLLTLTPNLISNSKF